MGISLTSTDELGLQDSKPAFIWPTSVDRSQVAPLDAIFIKDEHTGEIVIGYEDPDELDGLELTIQLDDGANSEYIGMFNADGVFIKS